MTKKIFLEIGVSVNPYDPDKLVDYNIRYHLDNIFSGEKKIQARIAGSILDIRDALDLFYAAYNTSEIIIEVKYNNAVSKYIGLNLDHLYNKLILIGSTHLDLVGLTSLSFNLGLDQSIQLRNLTVEKLIFPVSMQIRKLEFENIKFSGGELFNMEIDNALFRRVDFGSMLLSSVKFKDVIFYGCDLSRVILNDIFWPNGYNIVTKHDTNFSSKKEIYRQIKHVYDSIGNKTEANKFFAKEMEFYRKSLGWRDWDKKIISLIQEFSNGYGNSWIYPLGWIFFLSAIKVYFSGYLVHFDSVSKFGKEFSIFSEKLILNINLIDDFKEINNPIELIYRILLAFFIYQFLVALRRISQR